MLKKIIINGKDIPVPVPLKTLYDALLWVEQTLLKSGQVMTRVTVNGQNQEDTGERVLKALSLDLATIVEVQVDSPIDLLVQSFEAIYNLTRLILATIKPAAVESWQTASNTQPKNFAAMEADLHLVLGLFTQLNGLMDIGAVDVVAIRGQGVLLTTHFNALMQAKAARNWMQAARVMLNRIEPTLKDIAVEAESLHVKALTESAQAAKQSA